jgi:hypothetical protein
VTYAGAHGRDEVGSVNWILHREWVLAHEVHPLSVRRTETTKIALKDLEAPSNHLRLALGVAVGAILAAGTFVAGSLSGTSDGANHAGSVPEHASAPLEQQLSVTEPAAEAPAPVPAPAPAPVPAPTPAPAPAPVNEQPETAPAPTVPQADTVPAQDHAEGGGENQRTAPSTSTPAPAPEPPQWDTGGQWGSDPQWGYGSQWDSGSQWGYGQWGYGTQQWSPVSGFGAPTPSSYSAATSTPTGPAMSMLDPFCDTMGS